MQSSIRSPAPRPVPHRSPSSNPIEVEHEVAVISTRANSMKEATGKAMVSWSPSVSSGQRAQTSHGRSPSANIQTSGANRSNSVSRLLSRSQSATGLRPAEPDMELLESNRESMRELSEFLRTKEPPPDNWMSIPDNEEGHSFRRSAFKIFGRKSSNRNRAPKLLQLPDIAVAAKTLNGSRHIAISIPLQYDHPDNGLPSQRPLHPLTSSPPSKFPPPVTVLKPVVEGRESTSSLRKTSLDAHKEKREGGHSQQVSVTAPAAAELLGPETARTLKNYYIQLQRQHKGKEDSISSVKTGESKSQRSSQVGTSTDSMKESQQADPRHSGGTVYSAVTISPQDYSRRLSSVSTAPSVGPISPVKADLTSRGSSILKVPKPIQTELAQSYDAANFSSQQDPPRSSVLPDRTESFTSETSTYSTPSAVVSTTESMQGYNNNTTAGFQHPNAHALKPMSPLLLAPTGVLPDVPESPCIPDFLPSPSPSPPINRRKIAIGLIDEITSVPSNTGESTPTSQSRQERVRARKSRDIAALREKRASRDTISDAPSTANVSRSSSPGTRPSSSPQQARKQPSMSRERMRRGRNTISSIMLVADLPPHDGTGCMPNPPAKSTARKQVSDPNLMARGTYTPPRSSLGSSLGSDSDTTPKTFEGRGFGANSGRSSADQGLDNRRQERKVKRNLSLREKEMEIRLRKIERDNAMLMTTLSGIAGSFGQLNSLLPQSSRGNKILIREEIGRPQEVVAEIQKLEPVMRELQAGAGRVSMEESSSSRTVLPEDDESSIS